MLDPGMPEEIKAGDTRAQGRRLLGKWRFSVPTAVAKTGVCGLLALGVVWGPGLMGWDAYEGLSQAGVRMLAILVLAAGLWVSEAIPAFSVGILVIALEIFFIGQPGEVAREIPGAVDWELFVKPWSSPLMWLFLGGFVLAQAAVKTGLDFSFASRVLGWFGSRPGPLLAGVMAVTFVFSMFMSNTATAAMMMTVMAPVVAGLARENRFGTGMLLGIAMAANLGGMGTIIGTPSNAIAVGQLPVDERLSFLEWMLVGVPPALLLVVAAWFYLMRVYPSLVPQLDVSFPVKDVTDDPERRRKPFVLVVFFLIIGLWMTEELHGAPAAVTSFLAITLLAVGGVISAEDIRRLPWDVLILLAGGLALGVGIKEAGVAEWLTERIPGDLPEGVLVIALAFLGVILSNFMSNTATASILLPIAYALADGQAIALLAPVALACSVAMVLPISTPPNAVVYSSGRLEPKDFVRGGALMAMVGPIVIIAWCRLLGGLVG